jgi:hypothetical protein
MAWMQYLGTNDVGGDKGKVNVLVLTALFV